MTFEVISPQGKVTGTFYGDVVATIGDLFDYMVGWSHLALAAHCREKQWTLVLHIGGNRIT